MPDNSLRKISRQSLLYEASAKRAGMLRGRKTDKKPVRKSRQPTDAARNSFLPALLRTEKLRILDWIRIRTPER